MVKFVKKCGFWKALLFLRNENLLVKLLIFIVNILAPLVKPVEFKFATFSSAFLEKVRLWPFILHWLVTTYRIIFLLLFWRDSFHPKLFCPLIAESTIIGYARIRCKLGSLRSSLTFVFDRILLQLLRIIVCIGVVVLSRSKIDLRIRMRQRLSVRMTLTCLLHAILIWVSGRLRS